MGEREPQKLWVVVAADGCIIIDADGRPFTFASKERAAKFADVGERVVRVVLAEVPEHE